MIKIFRLAFLFAISVLFFSAVNADTVYTVKDCVDLAIKNNNDLKQRANTVLAANEKLKQIKGTALPTGQVTGNATYGKNTNDDIDALIQASLSYDFFDGGIKSTAIKNSEIALNISKENYVSLKQRLIYDVISAYIGVINTEASLNVAQRRVDYSLEQINMINARIDAGDAREADLYPLLATLANSRVDLIAARNNNELAKINLFTYLGVGRIADFATEDIEFKNTALPNNDDDYYYKKALSMRSDVKNANLAIESAKLSLQSTKLNTSPIPTLTGRVSQPIYRYNNRADYDFNYNITLGATWDFYTGGTNQAKVKEQDILVDNAKIARQSLEDSISYEVDSALLNITASNEKITAANESVTAAYKNFDAQNEMYRLGLNTTLDLQNAEITLITAQNNLNSANNDYLLSVLSLYYTLGIVDTSLDDII